MKILFQDKNRKDFAHNVFKTIANIKNGWQRLNKYLTSTTTTTKKSIVPYNLNGLMVVASKPLTTSDLMSGDNVRFFVKPFYSDNKTYAYLSTQWRHVGGNNLDIESLKEFINKEYADLFRVETNKNDFVLFQLPDWIDNEKMILPKMSSYQRILYGSPGTGKSWKIHQFAKMHNLEVVRTTFHPDTDYSSFVGTYKPTVKTEENGKEFFTYTFIPQAFTKTYVKAHQNPEKSYLLVIEEINRGNCAQIFGDLFQCLDRNDSGQSEYSIEAEADLAKYLESLGLSNQISLPPNLYLYATMNTSDQSLFPMDSAFKRRWDWEYVPIDYAKAAEMSIEIGEKRYNWAEFLKEVNEKIEKVQGEDKQIGNFFVKPDKPDNVISLEAFKSKVMFYLWSEVFRHEIENSIFQYKNDEDKTETFTFSVLFEEGRDIELLHRFMENLGIVQTS